MPLEIHHIAGIIIDKARHPLHNQDDTADMSFPGQAGLYKETVSRLAGVIGFTYVYSDT